MKLSCVIPATDSPPTLARCVSAIEAAHAPPEELIVIEAADRSGPAAARNAGAARATGEVLVFVDADVIVHRDAFERIRAAFDAEPTLTALFGSYDDAPEAPDAVSGFRNLLHHQVHNGGAGTAETFWAGLGAVRRGPFVAAGGFDASRFSQSSIEDVELGMRLVADGAMIRLDPLVEGTHLKRWRLAQMLWTDFARRGVPWVRLLLESGTLPTTLNLGWRHRVGAAASLAAGAAACARRPRAALAALILLVLVNAPLYRLLWRRRGPRQAVVGVGLHVAHHLTATAAVVTGTAAHVAAGRERSNGVISR